MRKVINGKQMNIELMTVTSSHQFSILPHSATYPWLLQG